MGVEQLPHGGVGGALAGHGGGRHRLLPGHFNRAGIQGLEAEVGGGGRHWGKGRGLDRLSGTAGPIHYLQE